MSVERQEQLVLLLVLLNTIFALIAVSTVAYEGWSGELVQLLSDLA